jgi:hypothetical protein
MRTASSCMDRQSTRHAVRVWSALGSELPLLPVALPPGHPVFFSALHHRVIHGLDVHTMLESLSGGRTDAPPAPLGPVVIPACQARGNDDQSADNR